MNDFIRIADEKNLMDHEKLRLISLYGKPFTEENELLTASGKLNRLRLIEQFLPTIEQELRSASSQWNSFLARKIAEIIGIPAEQVDIGKSFQDIGGDSLAAARLSKLLEGKVSSEFIKQLLKGDSITKALDYSQCNLEDIDAMNDCELTPALAKSFQTLPMRALEARNPQIYLLTGATGFVGSFLLKRLLEIEDCSHVFCLVRKAGKIKKMEHVYKLHSDESG